MKKEGTKDKEGSRASRYVFRGKSASYMESIAIFSNLCYNFSMGFAE